jgi:uncharacterized protein YfaS (alpha-2-macroglobulin family)
VRRNSWKKFLSGTAMLSSVWLGSCRDPNQSLTPLAVTSFAANALDDRPAIRLRFNQPVVGSAEIGKVLKEAPLKVSPAVPLSAVWEDRQTLVATPRVDLSPSTQYQVELVGPLSTQLAVPAFTFVAKPVVIEGFDGVNPGKVSTKPEITLQFNQQVNSEEVSKKCAFVLYGTTQRTAVSAAQKKVDTRITITPQKPLEQDKDYELRCDKIAGAVGTAAMDAPYSLYVRTFPKLNMLSFSPTEKDTVPADGVRLSFGFNNAIDEADFIKAVSFTPAVKGLDRGWWVEEGVYEVQLDLDPQTQYTVKVDGSLKDLFGQSLGKVSTYKFKTGDARPKLTMERGIYAVEDTAEGYAVWTRNINKFEVSCAPVPKESLVKLLTSAMDYDPWYDAEADTLDWVGLGLKEKKVDVKPKTEKNKWHLENLNLKSTCGGTATKGVYLAEVRSNEAAPPTNSDYTWRYKPYHRVLANVTNLGVLLKIGPASGLIWVTGFSDGKPVADATVTVYTPKGDKVFTGKTNKDGMLSTPGSAKLKAPKKPTDPEEESEYDFEYRAQRLIAIVESKDDVAIIDGNWANGIQTWNFGVQQEYDLGGTTKIRGFIQSDRGIYRPGETVGFKGIAREIALGKSPAVPAGQKVKVEIQDPRGAVVFDQTLALSAFGGFSFDLPIGEAAPLGDYYVSATLKGQTFRERFMVEEFKKVTYELALKSASGKAANLGDAVSFKLDADYLFGAPVTNATVQWNVQRRRHYVDFPKYSQYIFEDYAANGDSWWFDYGDYGYMDYVADGEGSTDENGDYVFSIKDPMTNLAQPQDYVAQVTVTDEADEVIAAQTVVTAHKAQYYLGIHPQEYVQAVDMPFAVNTVALSPDGKQISAKAKLRYIRWQYDCGYTGTGPNSYECTSKKSDIFSRDVEIPATGNGIEKITPKDPGQYVIQLEATDNKGNKIVASTFVYILGKGEAFWSGDESARMALLPSQESFNTGDIAKLVPKTYISGGTGLLTIERDGIISGKLISMGSSGQGVEVPIKGEYAPNVFASLAIVKGRTGAGDKNRPKFQMGVVELKVSTESHALTVNISTDKTTYEPGQDVTGLIRVTQNGKPVMAEVSLSVADEGVLQLIAYQTPNPLKTFYSAFGLAVENATTWNRIARRYNPQDMDADEGGDSGAAGVQVRSNFVSSAYWAPNLVTDASGEIKFNFKTPDNLTAFRLMAVAADKTDNFGSSDARITVKKPLLASPTLPRFLSAGDRAEVGVVVHNYTGAAGEATVTAEAQGFALDQFTQKVKLAANGSARVRFPGTASQGKEATFLFTVKMGTHGDGVKLTVPVRRPLVKETSLAGRGTINGNISIPVNWSGALLSEESLLEVSVDSTGMSELEGSLKYLIEYPYGCLEQTMSRLLPLIKVKDMAASLDLESLKGPNVDKFIKAGLARLAKFQHADGQFSLWQGGQPYPHLTVFAMYGITEAKRSKLPIDEEVAKRGLEAVKRWVSDPKRNLTDNGEAATMAMAAYVLANMGKADTGLNSRLYEARKSLPVYGRAFLLSAMVVSKGATEQRKTLLSEIVALIKTKGDVAFVQEEITKSGFGVHYYMSSDTRSTAIALSAILLADPKNAMLDKLADGLKQQQKPGGHWNNTQDNLFGLVALADYARSKAGQLVSVTITKDKKILANDSVKGSTVLRYKTTLKDFAKGNIEITTNKSARYSARLTLVREEKTQKAQDEGFGLTREYVDPETDKPVTSFKAGQLVKVKLHITSKQDRSWVALVDPLPAGLEPVNTRLATSEPKENKATSYYDYYDYYPFWTYVELRDDRVLAFADSMWRDKFTYEYLARATTTGEFTAPAASIEAMYEPDIFGRSDSAKITVTAK